MVDIQSAAAEIKRGKKEERKKKIETTGQNTLCSKKVDHQTHGGNFV